MGNSNGGILVIGLPEERDAHGPTGIPDPTAPIGVPCDNPEQILITSESRILSAIDERLIVESHAVSMEDGAKVFIFRIPNSVSKPHRVLYQGRPAFPARRERQGLELNATEIKEMVMRTASRIDRSETEIMQTLSDVLKTERDSFLAFAAVPVFTRNFAIDFRRPELFRSVYEMDLAGRGRPENVQPHFSMDGLTREGPRKGVILSLGHNGLLRLTISMPRNGEGSPLFPTRWADTFLRGLLYPHGAFTKRQGFRVRY